MQISSSYAIEYGFIKDRNENKLDPSKYSGKSSIDVTIGEIIHQEERNGFLSGKKKEAKVSNRYSLSPQETVSVISQEILDIPPNYVAYVFLKNRLSQQGLLAFNTGIIDGGYKGTISTLITNLSMSEIVLDNRDKYFFRVVIHKIDTSNSDKIELQTTNNDKKVFVIGDYRLDRKMELLKLPKYFLDREGVKKQIHDELDRKAMNLGLMRLTLIIAMVSIIMALVPMVSKILLDEYREYSHNKDISHEKSNLRPVISERDKAIKRLFIENEKLRHDIDTLKNNLEQQRD